MTNWTAYIAPFIANTVYGHYENDSRRTTRSYNFRRTPWSYYSKPIEWETKLSTEFLMNFLFSTHSKIIKNYEIRYDEAKKCTEYTIIIKGTKGRNNSNFISEFEEESFKDFLIKIPKDVKVSFYDVYGNDMSFLVGGKK